MSEIFEVLSKQFGGEALDSISRQVGMDQKKAGLVLSSALPVLVGAMARNTAHKEGAESLWGALQRDHDGSILNDLGGFLRSPQSGPGAGILKHVLGSRRQPVEHALSKQTGVDPASVGNLLEIAAPILMGMLGKRRRENNLDAEGISDILNSGARQMRKQAPASEGLLGSLLDQDNDGDIKDDVARMGFDLLGKFLRK